MHFYKQLTWKFWDITCLSTANHHKVINSQKTVRFLAHPVNGKIHSVTFVHVAKITQLYWIQEQLWSFLPCNDMRYMLSSCVCLSVCPYVDHKLALYQSNTARDVNRVPGPEKTTRSRVSNYPKATPASASPLRNDRTAGTAGTV